MDNNNQEKLAIDYSQVQKEEVKKTELFTPFSILSALFALVYVISSIYVVPFQYSVGIYVGISSVLIFTYYPARRKTEKKNVTIVDIILILMAIASFVYFVSMYDRMQLRAGLVTKPDLIFGIMAIIVALECCRRVLGWVLPIVAVLFTVYNLAGPFLPGFLYHPGFTLERVVGRTFHGAGIYGMVASTYARYVFLFLILGGLLERLGVIEALLELTITATSRLVGGAAKAAIISSAALGTIMGASMANIVMTGAFTIPLMKSTGYEPKKAGAVEVVSSVGGQMLPPVMGAGAFILASFTRIPYSRVILYALAPALLYYVALFAAVHLESLKSGVGKVSTVVDAPPFRETFKKQGILLAPILILIASLMLGQTAFRAAFISIVSVIIIAGWRYRSIKEVISIFWEGLILGSRSNLTVACTAGVVGIVISMVDLPGLPITFTSSLLRVAGDSIFLTYIFTALVSLVLGMGMTVTASYVLVAVLAAPAFVELGVPLFTAHLVAFWVSQNSMTTPPFAMGGFIAGSIAEADPFETAIQAFIYSWPLYIVTILMIYTPLLSGTWQQILYTFITSAVGAILVSGTVVGYLWGRCGAIRRILLAGMGAMMFIPDYRIHIAGIVLTAVFYMFQRKTQID